MCINFETSIIALFIGEISGILLLTQDKEKQMIGLFVMFYSLIQLFDANLYKYNNVALNSKLIILNLGFQGIVFFILMNQLYNINKIYIILCLIISFFILYKAFSDDYEFIEKNTCIKWNMTEEISLALFIMYGIMFFWYLNLKQMNGPHDTFINETGVFFFITLLIAYFYINVPDSPSLWCLASALCAPIFLLI